MRNSRKRQDVVKKGTAIEIFQPEGLDVRKPQCSQRGQSTLTIISSEFVKSHFSASLPAASAARISEPRCLVCARERKCCRQIPVRRETSSSVKNFWLEGILDNFFVPFPNYAHGRFGTSILILRKQTSCQKSGGTCLMA